MARVSILLAVLSVIASAQINLGNLFKGVNVQNLPVNVGGRVDVGYGFEAKKLDLGLAGEVLFPVYGPFRCRATLLSATLRDTVLEGIRFNTGAGLDLMMTFAGKKSRLWPYAFLGGFLELRGSNFDYTLLIGLGLEGRINRSTNLFGEVGYSHSYISQAGANNVLGRVGVRFGG